MTHNTEPLREAAASLLTTQVETRIQHPKVNILVDPELAWTKAIQTDSYTVQYTVKTYYAGKEIDSRTYLHRVGPSIPRDDTAPGILEPQRKGE